MIATIQLTPQDTLTSVVARLKAAQAERVVFIVPAELALTAVDLRILRREAAALSTAVALVTRDAGLRSLAGQAGISTYQSQARAERARVRRPRPDGRWRARPVGSAAAFPGPGPGLFDPHTPTGVHAPPFWRAYVRRANPWWATLGLICILLFFLGGLLAALVLILPAASVHVVPSSEPLQVQVGLRAIPDAEADTAGGIVPARGVSVQVAGEGRTATTGRRFEPSAKAVGQIVISNRTGRQLNVPAGTVVSTATGNNARFATTVEGKLEPNGRVTLPIEAVLPGLSGNVRAGTITEVEGPLSLSVVVSNQAATSGGGSTQVFVVTDEDKERLQAQLLEELKQKAYEKLTEHLAAGTFVPAESVQYLVLSPTFTPFVGDVSPELFLSMSVQATGLAVDTSSGNSVALDRLQRAMPPGSRLVADSVRYVPGDVTMDGEKAVAFTMLAQGTLLRGIDPAAARTTIQGLRPDQAVQALTQRFALATPPEISLGPDWLPLVVPTEVPSVPWRIRILVDWDQAAQLALKK